MNETMGSIIMRLRKERGMTQEQLANALGITFQAVSKWETGVSSPDLSALPLLAELFGVSIDELFGRGPAALPPVPLREEERGCSGGGVELPWPDDEGMLHAVLFAGHTLIGAEEIARFGELRGHIRFEYEGPALDIWSDFSVNCGDVRGSVNAGGDVDCEDVGGSVSAGGSVDCGDVAGDLNAGASVDCGDVMGSVFAGGEVDCGDVMGSIHAPDLN